MPGVYPPARSGAGFALTALYRKVLSLKQKLRKLAEYFSCNVVFRFFKRPVNTVFTGLSQLLYHSSDLIQLCAELIHRACYYCYLLLCFFPVTLLYGFADTR